MRSLSKDFVFVFASLIIFASFGWALFTDLTSYIYRGDGEPLGQVVFKKRVAQRKFDDQVIWQTITNYSTVYVNDSIRTASDSEAILILKDDTNIALDENTLIVLVRTGRGLGIDFQQGSMAAVAGEHSRSAFEITSGDARLDLAGADGVFRRDAGSDDFTVDVTRGQAVFERGGRRIDVQENEQLLLRAGAAEAQVTQASLVPRGGGGIVFTDTKVTPHTFSWSMTGVDQVTLDISRSASFSRDVQSRTTHSQSITLNLEEGSWFWRLRAPDGSTSRTERTTLIVAVVPRPLAPANGSKFTYFRRVPLISMQWAGDESVSRYTVQIARDANFADIARSVDSRISSISVDNLAEGEYWWRVVPHYTAAVREPQPGPAFSFTIEKAEAPPAIEVPTTSTVSTLQLEAQQVAVSWKGNSEYARYRLELSRSPDFSTIAHSEVTTANFSRLRTDIPEDRYFWRVAAMDEQGTVLAHSTVSEVDIRSPRPVVLMTPDNGAALVSEGVAGARVAFSWNDPNRGGRVRFELANDRDFLTTQRNVAINGNSQAITLPPGDYFWRVTVLNDQGIPVAGPAMRQFHVTAMLASPVLRRPGPGTVINMEAANSIDFAWDQVEGANSYRFILSMHQPNGSLQRVFEARVANTAFHFTLLNHLDRGRFSWDVQALLLDNERVRTESRQARSDFTIYLPELRKAAVVIPQVIYAD
jgi:hypothetical protein